MALQFKWLNADFAAAGQITPEDVKAAAAAGFRSIVNNRPDHEGGPAQPTSDAIEREAKTAGLGYAYVPVKSSVQTPADAEAMEKVLAGLAKPVLGFCRSGARTTKLYFMVRVRGE